MRFEAIKATVSGLSVQLKNMNKLILETINFSLLIYSGKASPLKGFYIDSGSYGDLGTFSHGREISVCMSVYIDQLSKDSLFFSYYINSSKAEYYFIKHRFSDQISISICYFDSC